MNEDHHTKLKKRKSSGKKAKGKLAKSLEDKIKHSGDISSCEYKLAKISAKYYKLKMKKQKRLHTKNKKRHAKKLKRIMKKHQIKEKKSRLKKNGQVRTTKSTGLTAKHIKKQLKKGDIGADKAKKGLQAVELTKLFYKLLANLKKKKQNKVKKVTTRRRRRLFFR